MTMAWQDDAREFIAATVRLDPMLREDWENMAIEDTKTPQKAIGMLTGAMTGMGETIDAIRATTDGHISSADWNRYLDAFEAGCKAFLACRAAVRNAAS